MSFPEGEGLEPEGDSPQQYPTRSLHTTCCSTHRMNCLFSAFATGPLDGISYRTFLIERFSFLQRADALPPKRIFFCEGIARRHRQAESAVGCIQRRLGSTARASAFQVMPFPALPASSDRRRFVSATEVAVLDLLLLHTDLHQVRPWWPRNLPSAGLQLSPYQQGRPPHAGVSRPPASSFPAGLSCADVHGLDFVFSSLVDVGEYLLALALSKPSVGQAFVTMPTL